MRTAGSFLVALRMEQSPEAQSPLPLPLQYGSAKSAFCGTPAILRRGRPDGRIIDAGVLAEGVVGGN